MAFRESRIHCRACGREFVWRVVGNGNGKNAAPHLCVACAAALKGLTGGGEPEGGRNGNGARAREGGGRRARNQRKGRKGRNRNRKKTVQAGSGTKKNGPRRPKQGQGSSGREGGKAAGGKGPGGRGQRRQRGKQQQQSANQKRNRNGQRQKFWQAVCCVCKRAFFLETEPPRRELVQCPECLKKRASRFLSQQG